MGQTDFSLDSGKDHPLQRMYWTMREFPILTPVGVPVTTGGLNNISVNSTSSGSICQRRLVRSFTANSDF